MAFTNAYTCGPNCAPTRAALMSGQYSPRTDVYTVGDPNRKHAKYRGLDAAENKLYLDHDLVTMADALQAAGYATGHFGKWHLGGKLGGRMPHEQGFDKNVGGTSAGGSTVGYFAKEDGSFDLPGLPPNGKSQQWLDDRLTDEALEFISSNKSQPFYVNLCFFAVHTPIKAPPEDISHFDGHEKGLRHKNKTYAGFIKSFDDNVGRMVSYLEDTDDPRNLGSKLIANTIVIFYSDNGGVGGFAGPNESGSLEITSQYPLREGKGSLHEGGIRVPLIVRWDGLVPRNSVNHTPVITVDFYPTLLDIAHITIPSNHILDGVSLLPLLTGSKETLDRSALYWHFPAYLELNNHSRSNGSFRTTPVSAIRSGMWKLLYYYETRSWELYNLENDRGETSNVADENIHVVKSPGPELISWLVTTTADLPRNKSTKEEEPLPLLPPTANSSASRDIFLETKRIVDPEPHGLPASE